MKANLETQNMTLKHELASPYFLLLNEMDTIVDFLQMIFKTSNTSALQDNNQRQNQKKFKNIEQERKFVGGGVSPKRKHVILTPSFPHLHLLHNSNHGC